jgi:hypothetical protein
MGYELELSRGTVLDGDAERGWKSLDDSLQPKVASVW